MVEEMLAARGICVTYETVRQWGKKFGKAFAESGNFSGVTPRAGGVAWGGTPRGPGGRASESLPATDREARH